MFDIILAALIFHALSSIALLAGCAIASFLRPAARTAARRYVDQVALEEDAILSNPVQGHRSVTSEARLDVDVAVA